ncbi:MAG TPA: DUF2284 domain-containing protein [Methanospirillum sp.]|nr:DUF2284 domain-containing protein [Methanospirillum sp.]
MQIHNFSFLEDKALALGAICATILPAEMVVVEHRIPLKCKTGCVGYGKKLTCPPYVPSVDEFKKIIREYQDVLLIQFRSAALLEPEVAQAPYRTWLDPSTPEDIHQKANLFWKTYFENSKEIHMVMLELEKTAYLAGYPNALALVNGSCRLCETCNIKEGICRFPALARIPEHAVGINMQKTAKNAGITLNFPARDHPTPMAILLIE